MNKKQILVFITILLLLIGGIITCGLFMLKDLGGAVIESLNFNELKEAFKEQIEIDSLAESNITLKYIDGESTGENNVFKVKTDLSQYYKKEDKEDLKVYPYIKGNGAYSYKDSSGKSITKNNYEYAEFFYEGLALVQQKGLYGFINKEFQNIIPCKYKYAISLGFQNGLAVVVTKNEEICVIDKSDKIILKGNFTNVDTYYNGIIIVEIDGEKRYYNLKGKKLNVFNNYDLVSEFQDGIAEVWNEEYGLRYINENGQLINIDGVREYGEFYNGTAILTLEGDKYITIDRKFQVIELKEKYLKLYTAWNNNMHCVLKKNSGQNDEYVYIDSTGNILFKSNYMSYEGFINGISPVRYEDKVGFIDLEGKLIHETDYKDIYILNENIFKVYKDDKVALIDSDRKLITKTDYYEIYVEKGIIQAYIDENMEYVDIYNSKGQFIGKYKSDFVIVDSDIIFVTNEDDENQYGYYININTGKQIEFKEETQEL